MSDFYSNVTRWGRIDNDGRIYSSDGTYLGRIYNDGKFYDSSYTYMGSIDKNGKIRNYKGMFPYYNGRIGEFPIGGDNPDPGDSPQPPQPPEPGPNMMTRLQLPQQALKKLPKQLVTRNL